MSKSANLTEEEIIQKVKFALTEWAFEDILRTSIKDFFWWSKNGSIYFGKLLY